MNIQNIIKAAEMAKTKTTDSRWLNAINRAVEAVSTNAWIVTELHASLLITSDSGETYRVNGTCDCRAGQLGQPCKHLALRRLMMRADEMETTPAEAPAPVRVPSRVTRSTEQNQNGHRLTVYRVDGWSI
jgi:hypothetical protein